MRLSPPLLLQALRLTGAWVSKTKSESSREILESYLNPAVDAALAGGGAAIAAAVAAAGGSAAAASAADDDGEGDDNDRGSGSGGGGGWGGEGARRLLCAAHFTLAEYLAGLYASVRGRVESPEWRAAGRVAESRARELASCRKQVCVCTSACGLKKYACVFGACCGSRLAANRLMKSKCRFT